MNLLEIRKKLKEIKNKGFIKSIRKGTTGIGYTFETIFGLKETNIESFISTLSTYSVYIFLSSSNI